MKVNFIFEDFHSQWGCDAIPRIGDEVQIDDFRTGTVTKVLWCMVDSKGRPTSDRYANVWLCPDQPVQESK